MNAKISIPGMLALIILDMSRSFVKFSLHKLSVSKLVYYMFAAPIFGLISDGSKGENK
jgi:uncharacterized phage-associated protein